MAASPWCSALYPTRSRTSPRHDPGILEAIIETMITHWQPECAVAVSHAFQDRYPEREPGTNPQLPYIGWLTYLHADRVAQLPAELPPELAASVTARITPDGGRLFIVDTGGVIFTASNPEHVARTCALHAFLRDHGALEPMR